MESTPCIYIVDDDDAVRTGLGLIIETAGYQCKCFASAEEFLEDYFPGPPCCLILDVNLPGLNGPQLQRELNRRNILLPIIFLTAHGDIPTTVRAIKDGAVDFLIKPVPSKELLELLHNVLELEIQKGRQITETTGFHNRINQLSSRELEILPLAIAGISNKEIGQRLGISHRTVEIHRIRILKKTGTQNFLELSRLCESNGYPISTTR